MNGSLTDAWWDDEQTPGDGSIDWGNAVGNHQNWTTSEETFTDVVAVGNVVIDTNYTLDFNASDESDVAWQLLQKRAPLAVLLLLFSVATVFGNMLVILAVIRERYLHTATNYFITSLAVADCLVGLVVMPFSAVYEVLENRWFFGMDWCDVWRSLDVLFSTASILNLCVISLDRYWAITDPFTYPSKMSVKRTAVLIAAVWVCSGAISFPAIVWWRAVRTEAVPEFKCPFTDHLGYLVFSSTISFYLPLFVMVFTYYRIYRAAVIQTRSLKLGTKQVMMASGEHELTLRIHRGGNNAGSSNSGSNVMDDRHMYSTGSSGTPDEISGEIIDATETLSPPHHHRHHYHHHHHQNNGLTRHSSNRIISGNTNSKNMSKNFSLSRKLAKFAKEKKAAKTLGIVMGVFIVCWLPFFVVNLLSGFCLRCIWNEELVSAVVTWLGWINSSMNPVIYACWSRDFRRAFVRILCVCCPRRMRRRYQPALRSKPSQYYGTSVLQSNKPAAINYSSVNQHELYSM
ncbi:dopamine receptor 2-like isoform X2 [Zootermopsis nevadensis]|uniref:dopamine receptor 2-like isoform X2 n=1 Tax=Zootermopsis nevadensis TaxID=136037 RepID=UPI000B8EE49A|nr:dopamine receptor 2-like isoform X2 [Zootermopsis nevadensis]